MSFGLLLRLDRRRAADAVLRPRAAFWAGAGLPATLLAAGAWLAGDGLRPDLASGDGRFLLGILASAPIAFQAHPVLFRPADDALLRRLGLAGESLFAHRALRLAALALGVWLLLMLPFLRGGQDVALAASTAGLAALVGWGTALLFVARGAELTVRPGRRPGVLDGFIGWDRELARNGPLVYAPILPVVTAAFAARLLPASLAGWAAAGVAAGGLAMLGRGRFTAALPRVAPHAAEIAWVPPATDRAGELVTGRGLPALLPRGAQLVLARDALVAGRRHRWAARLVPIVGVIGALALLRLGDAAAGRRLVLLAAAGTLAALAGVVLALGRAERSRTRWIDRSLGLTTRDRLLGRGAFAIGRSMLLALPVGLVWAMAAPTAPWTALWLTALGGLTVAALSLAAAGR